MRYRNWKISSIFDVILIIYWSKELPTTVNYIPSLLLKLLVAIIIVRNIWPNIYLIFIRHIILCLLNSYIGVGLYSIIAHFCFPLYSVVQMAVTVYWYLNSRPDQLLLFAVPQQFNCPYLVTWHIQICGGVFQKFQDCKSTPWFANT